MITWPHHMHVAHTDAHPLLYKSQCTHMHVARTYARPVLDLLHCAHDLFLYPCTAPCSPTRSNLSCLHAYILMPSPSHRVFVHVHSAVQSKFAIVHSFAMSSSCHVVHCPLPARSFRAALRHGANWPCMIVVHLDLVYAVQSKSAMFHSCARCFIAARQLLIPFCSH